MVAQNTVRTYGESQGFRFVERIRFHRKSRQIRKSDTTYFTLYVLNYHLIQVPWSTLALNCRNLLLVQLTSIGSPA